MQSICWCHFTQYTQVRDELSMVDALHLERALAIVSLLFIDFLLEKPFRLRCENRAIEILTIIATHAHASNALWCGFWVVFIEFCELTFAVECWKLYGSWKMLCFLTQEWFIFIAIEKFTLLHVEMWSVFLKETSSKRRELKRKTSPALWRIHQCWSVVRNE